MTRPFVEIEASSRRYSYTITPSKDKGDEFVATVAEFPSLSSVEGSPSYALVELMNLVSEVILHLESNGEPVPSPNKGR